MSATPTARERHYHVVALQLTIVFNRDGDHDHNGMIYALEKHRCYLQGLPETPKAPDPLVRPLVLRARVGETVVVHFTNHIRRRCVGIHLVGDGYNVNDSDGAAVGKNPSTLAPYQHPRNCPDDDMGDYPKTRVYRWRCKHEGVFPFHDAGNLSGGQEGTNVHGLFGALVVEPADADWTDPVTGDLLSDLTHHDQPEHQHDGLYVDVHPLGLDAARKRTKKPFMRPPCRLLDRDASFREYAVFFHDEPEFVPGHHQVHPPNPCKHAIPGHNGDGNDGDGHGDGCRCCGGDHDDCRRPPPEHLPPIMPISYRAEPMVNREHKLWKMMENRTLLKPVIGEEQHHSSWLFGDPATPILRAYAGDPFRIRLVHGGVKETHVFHLHVYQWHAAPDDAFGDANELKRCESGELDDSTGRQRTPVIDSISISPQTGHTIVPLFGAGSGAGSIGDAIWHCHLYPHFHEGMWGLMRTFDRRRLDHPPGTISDANKVLYQYPDGTPIDPLQPLPDRQPPPDPTHAEPGYPNFMWDRRPGAGTPGVEHAGIFGQKSPIPPWPEDALGSMPGDFDYRNRNILPTELAHLNCRPRPGAIFNLFPWNEDEDPDDQTWQCPWDETKELPLTRRHMEVVVREIIYNPEHRWHDPLGHLFRLLDDKGALLAPDVENEGVPVGAVETPKTCRRERRRPLVFRGNRGDAVEITFANNLPGQIGDPHKHHEPPYPFDLPLPPCDAFNFALGAKGQWVRVPPLVECGLHVHLVKFDPLVADGASTGWNYLSGPRRGMKMVYRWNVDDEFGTVFFHDHLFANFRQKRGLFGAMIAEPRGAKFFNPRTRQPLDQGLDAVVVLDKPDANGRTGFREFCFALADFIPMYERGPKHPLNPPEMPGGHSDNGVMGVNYRCEPIRKRVGCRGGHRDGRRGDFGDPAYWFHSGHLRYTWGPHDDPIHVDHAHGDPCTDVFLTYPNEPIRIHLFQGSHEEQHSFQIHGLRWRQFLDVPDSPLRNQQSLGISEAFDFDVDRHLHFGPGDYLFKSSPSDDLWLGVWGIIRALGDEDDKPIKPLGAFGVEWELPEAPPAFDAKAAAQFRVVAERRKLAYRDFDLVDPYAIVYRLESFSPPGSDQWIGGPQLDRVCCTRDLVRMEPLILRCRAGAWVEVTLRNCLPTDHRGNPDWLEPEPCAPEVPLERRDRPVSPQVSIHADLLVYDVRHHDGANVGHNPPNQTVKRGTPKSYRWFADAALAEGTSPAAQTSAGGGTGGSSEAVGNVILLQDMADFRNHRHHGLVGALVVEPPDVTPMRVPLPAWPARCPEDKPGGCPHNVDEDDPQEKCRDEAASTLHPDTTNEAWYGSQALLTRDTGSDAHEVVVLLQDGLRFFWYGDDGSPLPDEPPGPDEDAPDPEDQGHKAFNYRSEPMGEPCWMHIPHPATPVFVLPPSAAGGTPARLFFRLAVAADKPRQYSFTVHGHTWESARPMGGALQRVGAVSALSTASVETLLLDVPSVSGDYAYRTGVLRWALPHGLWGILRVGGSGAADKVV